MSWLNSEWFASGEYLLVLATVIPAVIFVAVFSGFIYWVKRVNKKHTHRKK